MISFKNEPSISFKTAVILVIIIVISFAVISILLENEFMLRMIFSDLASPIIELLVIISLFYAARRSAAPGKRVEIGWMLMAVASMLYFLGDVTWGILEIVLQQTPFPSVADIFYLSFYPIFALGIYYLPRMPFTRREEFKLVLDMAIVLITVGLIFWTFLIIPDISNQENFYDSVISVIYILGDFFLLFVLLRLIYSKFEKVYYGPLILLGVGVMGLIVTDSIYYLQTLQGTYISGGLLDTGWILSFAMIGLAALLKGFNKKYEPIKWSKFQLWLHGSILTSYLPLVWVLIAFILLTWVNENQSIQNSQLIEMGVGFVIFLVLIRQIVTLNENKNLYLAAEKEINNRKEVEKALKESEGNYRELVDNSMVAVYKTNLKGEILFANNAMAEIFHFDSLEDLKAINVTQLYKNRADRNTIIEKLKREGSFSQHELEMTSNTGEILTIILSANLLDENISGMMMDITRRKIAENDVKKSLKEKEILLKEIHHRVKNNLQIISSLLDLQEAYVKEDSVAVTVLKESQNRVLSMAMLHEMLYQSKDLSHINFSNYIRSLTSNLFNSYGIQNRIKPVIDIEQVFMNIETSVPCGLIISELVSNSLKYAYPDNATGKLLILLQSHGKDFELIVSDDGVGFPEDLDFRNTGSLGLKLVNTLVLQLDGTIELDRSQGTKFTIKFKELKYKERI